MSLAAIGFAILTQLGHDGGPTILFVGMIVFCMGLAPIGALTTDLVISAAPPERAGAASGISETSFEFGGALGIAVLGSVIAAFYRMTMDGVAAVPGISAQGMDAARGTLSGAITAAQGLPAAEAGQLLATARAAFVHAFEITSANRSVVEGEASQPAPTSGPNPASRASASRFS
jgi:DHA2 family multidrug resistance protein-like MFS transporter